jgi:SAM-dependent methyltransferase
VNDRGAYDIIAELYDEDMGPSAPSGDVQFYAAHAGNGAGPIVELGCGTGRITLALVQGGHIVEGIDASRPMLRELNKKASRLLDAAERRRLTVREADMRVYAARRRFARIFCPYSAFTYLVADEDQAAVLQRVRSGLAPGGEFIVDLFVQRQDFLRLPDDHVFYDYRRTRSDGSILEREKRIAKDMRRRINLLRRTYRLLSRDGAVLRSFTTEERIRYFWRDEFRLLLERHGFEVCDLFGDFEGGPHSPDSPVMIFVCRARTR